MSNLENQTPIQDTSRLGIVSSYVAKFSFACITVAGFFMLYLALKPCKYGHICELPPFGIFLLMMGLVIAVLSLFGLLIAYIAPQKDTSERMLKRQQGLEWNGLLLGLSLAYVLFFIMAS